MRLTFTLLIAIAFSYSSFSQTSGGPDAFGYRWKNSNDPNGPAYNWIDITTTGTLVTGLGDDNSIGFVPMGIDFQYYWGVFKKAKIGSNGWIAFDNVTNIAHGFPNLPTPGGVGDNFLAPYMGDLSLAGAGNVGKVYYWTNYKDTFIVSYEDVPWWVNAAPGYQGANSFQVILCENDSSFTYQYKTVSPIANVTTFNDLVIGNE